MDFLRKEWRSRLVLFLAVVGPGFITANVDNDANGIATYSVAGAQFGYSLLWTMIPTIVALVVVQEMSARMGAVTGKGLSDLIREEFGLRTTFILMLALVATNYLNIVGEFAGVAPRRDRRVPLRRHRRVVHRRRVRRDPAHGGQVQHRDGGRRRAGAAAARQRVRVSALRGRAVQRVAVRGVDSADLDGVRGVRRTGTGVGTRQAVRRGADVLLAVHAAHRSGRWRAHAAALPALSGDGRVADAERRPVAVRARVHRGPDERSRADGRARQLARLQHRGVGDRGGDDRVDGRDDLLALALTEVQHELPALQLREKAERRHAGPAVAGADLPEQRAVGLRLHVGLRQIRCVFGAARIGAVAGGASFLKQLRAARCGIRAIGERVLLRP